MKAVNVSSLKKTCLIGKRDFLIFEYLFEHKVSLIEQIAKDIFLNRAYSTVANRLSKLARYGWLEKKPINFYGQPRTVYNLSKKAFVHCIDSEWDNFTHTQLKSDSILHDVQLIEIKKKFLCLKSVVKVVSENHLHKQSVHHKSMLRSDFSRLRSDAAISFDFGTGKIQTVPLELELSQKSQKQCRKKILEYYTTTTYPLILYINSLPGIQRQMQLCEEDFAKDKDARLYFCDLNTVLSHQGQLKFKNRNGKVLTLQ